MLDTLNTNKSITSQLQDLLNKEWKGKRFVYHSKYGGVTFGEVQTVGVSLSFRFDEANSLKLKHLLDSKKHRVRHKTPLPKPEIPVVESWTGFRPEINIVSTNNICYSLDDIFIISKPQN